MSFASKLNAISKKKRIEIKSVKPKICSDSSLVIKNGSA